MTDQNLTAAAAVDLTDLVSAVGVALGAVAHVLDKNKVIAKADFASVLRQAAEGMKAGKPNHPRGENRADVSMLCFFADCMSAPHGKPKRWKPTVIPGGRK